MLCTYTLTVRHNACVSITSLCTPSYYSDCLRIAFMNILQNEIKQVATEWNNHPIRPSSTAVPNGSPEELFFMPALEGM